MIYELNVSTKFFLDTLFLWYVHNQANHTKNEQKIFKISFFFMSSLQLHLNLIDFNAN